MGSDASAAFEKLRGIGRSSGAPFFVSYGRGAFRTLLPFGVIASLTVLFVVLWDRFAFVAIALIGPLMAITLYQLRMHGAVDRLRERDRLNNEFVAIVSHELRTPVASVYGAALTLQRTDIDRAQRDLLLTVIDGESARLARLVDQLLWASRLDAGKAVAAVESCDAVELAAEVVAAASTHLPDDLSLELLARDELPPVAADREKLKQVLVNLIENAVKYSPGGGRIDVRIGWSNGMLQFAIRDEGIGIPANEHGRIFEKFHRLGSSLKQGIGGTGLGLYISQELVEQMNGNIWIESREGEGSTFTFELPAA